MSGFKIPLGRFLDTDPISVIDIGSNSVRLVVYEGARRSPATLFNEKVLCGLGKSLASKGILDDDSVERALETLKRFRAISQQLGSTKINAIATAAARDAKNGKDFIAKAEKVIGHDIQILSGEEEASFAAMGVTSGIYKTDGVVADLGGGSLELTNVEHEEIRELVTLPLGVLRLMDESGRRLDKCSAIIDKHVRSHKWALKGKGRALYLVGGSWRAFAKLLMIQTRYPLRYIHDYDITVSAALKFTHLMDHIGSEELDGINDIPRSRRDTVIYGALVLKSLIEFIQPSHIVFSGYGIREGVLYKLLTKEEKQQDPLYAACYDLARLRARSPQNLEELCDWIDNLFRSAGFEEKDYAMRLRRASCLLSDIAWRTHPDYRGEHSMNLISQGAFAGVDHFGRVFLAMSVFFRHEGRVKTKKLPEISKLLDQEAIDKARIIGFAIRVANLVSANMPGILPHTTLVVKNGKLVLNLPKPYTILEGERLMNRLARLAQLLDCEPKICSD